MWQHHGNATSLKSSGNRTEPERKRMSDDLMDTELNWNCIYFGHETDSNDASNDSEEELVL